ncbi:MAG: exosortase C-terminal domain/associated protein EpsI [Pseudomonadota bacterium]
MNRRDFTLGALLGLGGLGGLYLRHYSAKPVRRPPDLARLIPEMVGPWRKIGVNDVILPPADALSQSLYDRFLVRGYRMQQRPPITLVIAYGAVQSYRLQLHRPESCYPASGFALRSWQDINLDGMSASFLMAERDLTTEAVLYWSRIGDRFPRNISEQRLAIAQAALRLQLTDGILVRLAIRNADPADALAAMREFVPALDNAMPPTGRMLLFGGRFSPP